MATKLFKRTNSNDVFDHIIEQQDSPDTDTGTTQTAKQPQGSRDAEPDKAADGTAEDARSGAPSRRRRWVRYAVVGLAAVIFVAVSSAAGFLGWQFQQQREIDNAGSAARSAAEHFAVILTSIDSAKVDRNFAEVIDGSTGEFKDIYSQSASQLRQVLIDNKAMSKGTVIDTALKSVTPNKVDVLVFVDQWITNVANPEPRLDRSRVAMTMELVDGRWLTSKVELK
jgi:Mce-associated membrane protein